MGKSLYSKIACAAIWFVSVVTLLGQSMERSFSRMDLLDKTREITSEDRLRYQVLEEQSPAVILNSDSEGQIRFPPLMESIPVTGKTCYDLARELKALLEVDFFYRATVIVEVAESSFREHVTVFGEVQRRGRMLLAGDGSITTISQAIAQMGGFLPGANLKEVTVVRKNADNPEKEDRITVNMDEIVNEGNVALDIPLQGDDVIIVGRQEEMGGRYSVLGAVNSPGLYIIEEEELTVSDAILLAGGFTEVARESRVKLTRQIEDSDESETFYINVKRVLEDGDRREDMLIKPDDIINVSEKIIVF